jgi:dTDP-4-dehydrorhamnose reductase
MTVRRPVLVLTGGSGLLATNWAFLMREHWDVVLLVHQKNVRIPGVEACRTDLSDPDTLCRLFRALKPNVVVHTVAMTDVDRCESESELAWQVNVHLAATVAAACDRVQATLLHVSTDQLFDGSVRMADEKEPARPLNAYGTTKHAAEEAVLSGCHDALVVRTNFYGFGHRFRRSFSDWILRGLQSDAELRLFDDVFYTPIYVDHLIEACHGLLEAGAKGVIHVVGGERLSKFQFGVSLASAFELDGSRIVPISIDSVPLKAARPPDMSLSAALASKLLGKPMPSTIDGLKALRRVSQGERPGALLAAVTT